MDKCNAIDYTLYKRCEEFSNNVFNYLNGKLNTVNIAAQLKIMPGNCDHYAHTNNADIELFLWTIMSVYNDNEKLIKTFIIEAIAHELAHMDQTIDRLEYISNKEYAEEVEKQAISYSCNYIIKHYKDIVKNCGSGFEINIIFHRVKDLFYVTYPKIELNTFYIENLHRLVGTDENKFLVNNLDEYDNVIVIFDLNYTNTTKSFLVKANNELSKDTLTFNTLLARITNSRIRVLVEHKMNDKHFGNVLYITVEEGRVRREKAVQKVLLV